jgi:protein-S-isoprenylcysteine O-methyltransferase Ste14
MERFICRYACLLLVLFRLWLSARLCLTGVTGGIVLGLSGFLAVLTTILAWRHGEPDYSYRGLVVGFGYLAPLLFLPVASASTFYPDLLWLLFCFHCLVRIDLWDCCTVASPIWNRLVDSGFYSVVRHPLTLTEMAIDFAFFFQFISLWNFAVLLLVVPLKVCMILCEEKFLCQYWSYRFYSLRVRWRLIPKIW